MTASKTKMCADKQTHTNMEADAMTYSLIPFFLCTVGMQLLWRPSIFSSLSLLSWTHCSPVTHTDVKTNTLINSQKQTHSHTLSTETCTALSSPPLGRTASPSIATNISHELSATSPSWIFIKQNSKQIDFTPAALLHFYLILSLIQTLTCSSLPLLWFHCSILSLLFSFLMFFLFPLWSSCVLPLLCIVFLFSLLSLLSGQFCKSFQNLFGFNLLSLWF